MRAVTALDHARPLPPAARRTRRCRRCRRPRPRGRPRPSPTGSYAADYTGEAVLSLLRFASQLLARAVVFSVDGDTAQRRRASSACASPAAAPEPRPCGRPSSRCASPRSSAPRSSGAGRYAGPLEPTRVNLALVERLGGAQVREAVAVPLVVGGEVRFVLYGDNAPSGRPLGPLETLESSAARAARIIEKTLAARAGLGPTGPPDPRRAASPLPIRRPRAYSRAREPFVGAR